MGLRTGHSSVVHQTETSGADLLSASPVGPVVALLIQAVAVSVVVTFLEPVVRPGMKVIEEDMLMLFDALVESEEDGLKLS